MYNSKEIHLKVNTDKTKQELHAPAVYPGGATVPIRQEAVGKRKNLHSRELNPRRPARVYTD
jgi:hypothetical protein